MGTVPPQALEAEESVLGAMLLESSNVDRAMEELTPGCFYSPRNRMIFEAISSLVQEHSPVDIITVTNSLRAKGNLESVGGAVVLADLSQKVGAAVNLEFYIKILKQKSIQRDLITASYQILRSSYDDTTKVDDLIDMAQTKIYDAIKNNVQREIQSIGSVINETLADIESKQGQEGPTGVRSGFPTIDRITGGWQPSDLIILAARPSVGKTAFALNLVRNAAVLDHKPVAFFSLEMSAMQLAKRMIISESGISGEKIKGGVRLEPYEWEQLEYKLKALSKAPLYIDDTPGIPIMEFRTKLKTLVNNKGVKFVIVDYLQLMQGPQELRSNREQEVAFISRTLKATAKELNVPIIALSQLSRNAVQRQGGSGKPQLSDLRESGSIEQDADMVIFIHRPDYLGLSDEPGDKEKTEIIIAKHRNGETAEIPMRFRSSMVRFVENDESLLDSQPVESGMNNDDPFGGASYAAPGEFANSDF